MLIFGKLVGILSIPMALLAVASMIASIWLALSGAGTTVVTGLSLFAGGWALAWITERLMVGLDEFALATRMHWGRSRGQIVALLVNALPVAVVMFWQIGCFNWLNLVPPAGANALAIWLFSYALATGPWMACAHGAVNAGSTVSGIRAYAAHLSYWLLSVGVFAGVTSVYLLVAMMLLPSLLPWIIGALIAVADRDTLRHVRI